MSKQRNYSLFDADLSGAVLNMHLLGRLLKWLRPYRKSLIISTVLVLIASTLQILLPIIISLVAIDGILSGNPAGDTPDFGLIALNEHLSATDVHANLLSSNLKCQGFVCVLYHGFGRRIAGWTSI